MPAPFCKHLLVRLLLASLAFLLISTSVRNESNTRRDGNWWIALDEGHMYVYVVGIFDGVNLGHEFSYWGIMDKQKDDPALQKIVKSFDEYSAKYLTNVTSSQLADGLDEFYSDYRNRRIKIEGGVWLVLNEIAGAPQAQMQTMIEDWRKNAVPSPQ